jgi:hypothetical protein
MRPSPDQQLTEYRRVIWAALHTAPSRHESHKLRAASAELLRLEREALTAGQRERVRA